MATTLEKQTSLVVQTGMGSPTSPTAPQAVAAAAAVATNPQSVLQSAAAATQTAAAAAAIAAAANGNGGGGVVEAVSLTVRLIMQGKVIIRIINIIIFSVRQTPISAGKTYSTHLSS